MKNKKIIAACVLLGGVITLASCGGDNKCTEIKYTYRSAVSGSPNTWNPHEWETSDDSIIMGFTTSGLYEFVFNETKDGYKIVPEMADGEPTDVSSTLTDEEAARYGVKEEKEGGVYEGVKWTVDLREDAQWENGEPINADTYVYSMERMLSPDMLNFRASSYYSGSVTLGNAKDYYNGGHDKYEFFTSSNPSIDGNKKYFSFFAPLEISNQVGGSYAGFSMYDYYNDETRGDNWTKDYQGTGEPCSGYKKLQSGEWGSAQNQMYVDLSVGDNLALAQQYINEWFQVMYERDAQDSEYKYFFFKKTGKYDRFEFDSPTKAVGIEKTGDYQITLYLSSKTTAFDFKYNFSSNWIVHKATYEAGYTQVGNLTKTTYGTTKENYMGFGPYKLSSYQTDKSYHMTRNEKYFLYNEPGYDGKEYQCTDIDIQVIPQHATQLQMFLKGELDDMSLQREDMATYGQSSRLYYEPNTYTSKVTFNTSYSKLVERQNKLKGNKNKTIITNPKFREAFFWSLDRKSFCANLTAGSSPAVVPVNRLYVADTQTGKSYRDTDQGKSVVTDLVGENTNGYNLSVATALFQAAYEEEIASTTVGHYAQGQDIVLEYLVYNSEDIYDRMIDFFQTSFDNATKGTGLEGKILIKKTVDPDYYDTMQAGDADMIYTTWGGAQLNPYGMLQCYCDKSYLFEYGFDPDSETLEIDVKGDGTEMVTKTYNDWYNALDGDGGAYSSSKADMDTRLRILAAVELALCRQYRFVSLYARSSAYLLSKKIEQGVNEYVPVMGYGGIRDYKFNYTDCEFAKICGNIDYTK